MPRAAKPEAAPNVLPDTDRPVSPESLPSRSDPEQAKRGEGAVDRPAPPPHSKSSSSRPERSPAEGPASPPSPSRLFAGTSGWAYPTWKPGFYPARLPQKSFLSFYASALTSVEVNYTFRTLPTPRMLETWLAATPENFRFSFKAPQRITHFSRLRDCAQLVQQFVSALEPVRQAGKLGLLLFQLPPNFKADPDRLSDLLRTPSLNTPEPPPVAFEFRHESWFNEPTFTLLRDGNAALCIAESDDLATPEVHTAHTHVCFRLRRNGGYTPAEIHGFAQRLLPLTKHRDVYAYFKHEDEPTGALNAQAFLADAAALANQP